MSESVRLNAASERDLSRIAALLESNGLPMSGVKECMENFLVARDENGICVGVAGFELYGQSCLLRSVAIAKEFQGRGYGRKLVEAVLTKAKAQGANTAYLLTEGARGYFERFGFSMVDRKIVDEKVKASQEFTELCDETAVAMRKTLV